MHKLIDLIESEPVWYKNHPETIKNPKKIQTIRNTLQDTKDPLKYGLKYHENKKPQT